MSSSSKACSWEILRVRSLSERAASVYQQTQNLNLLVGGRPVAGQPSECRPGKPSGRR
jgi:hypothetical protein